MHWKRALGLGFVSWLVPFVVSVAIFPLKTSHPPLFDIALSAVLTTTAVALGCAYLRRPGLHSIGSAVLLGSLWMGINIGLDLLLFTWGPMAMPPLSYLTDIGLSYVVYPIILAGLYSGSALNRIGKPEAKAIETARSALRHRPAPKLDS
jgi:hypothetical protein